MMLHRVKHLTLHGVQHYQVARRDLLRNFLKKFSQEKRRCASPLPLGRGSRAAYGEDHEQTQNSEGAPSAAKPDGMARAQEEGKGATQ